MSVYKSYMPTSIPLALPLFLWALLNRNYCYLFSLLQLKCHPHSQIPSVHALFLHCLIAWLQISYPKGTVGNCFHQRQQKMHILSFIIFWYIKSHEVNTYLSTSCRVRMDGVRCCFQIITPVGSNHTSACPVLGGCGSVVWAVVSKLVGGPIPASWDKTQPLCS